MIFFHLFTFLFILEEIVSRTRALVIQCFFLIYLLFYSFQKINIFSDLGPFCHPEPQGFCIDLIFISDPGPLVELSLRVF